jgi:hypothetical protein
MSDDSSTSETEDGDPWVPLSEWMQQLSLDPRHSRRHGGTSTGDFLSKRVYKLMKDAVGHAWGEVTRRPEFWRQFSVCVNLYAMRAECSQSTLCQWEAETIFEHQASVVGISFPDPDLLRDLVDLYFKRANMYYPLLHRFTFQKALDEDIHLHDVGFAGVALLVCAVGAQWSDDPRVFLPDSSTHSAGWKWYNQVRLGSKSILAPVTLYDLQQYCVGPSPNHTFQRF